MKKASMSNISKVSKQKPDWDSTISDLSVHKLTSQELVQRKVDHQSKHQAIYFQADNSRVTKEKGESVYDRLSKTRYGKKVKEMDVEQRKNFLKKMFVSDQELFELFQESERTLADVESKFGDHSKRYQAEAFVTPAPDIVKDMQKNSRKSSLASVVLNDCSNSDNYSNTSVSCSEQQGNNNCLELDELARFRRFIENERKIDTGLKEDKVKGPIAQQIKNDEPLLIEDRKLCSSPSSNNDCLSVLNYIWSNLTGLLDPGDNVSMSVKKLSMNLVTYLLENDSKNRKEIDSLREDVNHNKELIDALTLELINKNEKVKELNKDMDIFSKAVNREISEIKSLIIKNLAHRDNLPIQYSPCPVAPQRPNIIPYQFITNPNYSSDYAATKDQNSLSEQLKKLQTEHDQTQKRLKKLLKVQESVIQEERN